MIEKEFIHFIARNGHLIENRFRSSMPWPRACRMYALASDPIAVERCRSFAISNSGVIPEYREIFTEIGIARSAELTASAAELVPKKVAIQVRRTPSMMPRRPKA
ncbi:hypothetical protein AB4Z52_29415 [Rhizobium sp. 2YAF20]|uniref:hypothetical protein n=1 Tax=Rhizobium sp. 2YAF20 TaxID=3233027 RepID=UPI003F9C77C3